MTKHTPIRRSPPIRITPEVYRLYRQSIALHPPETFAILGGRLDDPYLVSEFRFCPPRRLGNGAPDASATHINVDPELLNWIVDHDWMPAGLYLKGIWHSHPPGITRPSVGDAGTNQGDIAFFSSCLAHDDSPDNSWRVFLAPITTFDADGTDRIHGWCLQRGADTPLCCHVVIDPFAANALDDLLPPTTLSPLPAALAPFLLSKASDDDTA